MAPMESFLLSWMSKGALLITATVGQLDGHNVVVDALADEKLMVQGNVPDGELEIHCADDVQVYFSGGLGLVA